MLKGIRLSHGVVFVTDELNTIRLLPTGECGTSPITYPALERDMCFEPPNRWEYLSEADIRALPDGGYDKIQAALFYCRQILGESENQ